MNGKVLGFGGFSKVPPEEQFGKGLGITKDVDYLRKIREERFFPLTMYDSEDARKETERIMYLGTDINKNIIVTWSYGMIPAVLQEVCVPKKLIIVVPPFGTNSVRWKWYEKILLKVPWLFPGFAEMENPKFWKKIFFRLKELKERGTEIIFFIPKKRGYNNKWSYYLEVDGLPEDEIKKITESEDERVRYTVESIEKMLKVGTFRELPCTGHKVAIQNEDNIKAILKAITE